MRIRNPKNDDLGEVLSNDDAPLENCFLYDGKEFLVQKKPDTAIDSDGVYTILVREWLPDTWAFAELHEI